MFFKNIVLFLVGMVFILSCKSNAQNKDNSTNPKKLFGKYTYVKKLPDIKLLRKGIDSASIFKILGRQTGGSIDDEKYYPDKNVKLVAMGRWYLYSTENNQPRLLQVWVHFSKTVKFKESARERFFESKTTPEERNSWVVKWFKYEYPSYKEEKKKKEDSLAQEKKNQKIQKHTICSPVSYKIINAEDVDKKIYIELNVKIQNQLDSAVKLVFSFTAKGSKDNPGFFLPPLKVLEYYSKGYNKGWFPLGTDLQSPREPEITISANGSKIIKYFLEVPGKKNPFLNDLLRAWVGCYAINGGDLEGKLMTQPFKLKDILNTGSETIEDILEKDKISSKKRK